MKMILTKSGKNIILSKPEPQPKPVLRLMPDEEEPHVPWDEAYKTA